MMALRKSGSPSHRQTKVYADRRAAYSAAMDDSPVFAPPPGPPDGEIQLIAGPPPANPPLLVALSLVGLSIVAPFLFLKAGSPSLLLGIAVLALAGAGIITMSGAATAQLRRRADTAIRPRASITKAGITLHVHPVSGTAQHFPAGQIHSARLLPGALVIQTAKDHPKPGRHVLRFGKLATPRTALEAALAEFVSKI